MLTGKRSVVRETVISDRRLDRNYVFVFILGVENLDKVEGKKLVQSFLTKFYMFKYWIYTPALRLNHVAEITLWSLYIALICMRTPLMFRIEMKEHTTCFYVSFFIFIQFLRTVTSCVGYCNVHIVCSDNNIGNAVNRSFSTKSEISFGWCR